MRRLKFLVFFLIVLMPGMVCSTPVDEIPAKERCPICGMFVEKYPTWISQVHLSGGNVKYFDGVKDMLVFYFHPKKYGENTSVQKIYVKNYYTQQWIDGKQAYYVTGSKITGPMGHEFIPFSDMDQAESFKKDHNGIQILRFEHITPEMVDAMRSGHGGQKMHTMKKKGS